MSYIQLPYGVVNEEKQIKLNLPKNYSVSQYVNKLPYLSNTNNPAFQNLITDTLNNRAYLRKYLLATSDYGKNIQENINLVVTDGKFNDALVRHVLVEKNKDVFDSSTPLSVTFNDAKKIDVQNPIIGNIISQVNAKQIGEKVVKELFGRPEDEKIRRRLEALRGQDDEDDGGREPDGQPPPPPLPPQRLPSPPSFSPKFSQPPPSSPLSLDNLPDSEGGFFGTESLSDVRNDLWNNPKFETDYSRPVTSLTDKAENTIEVIPKIKERLSEPEEIISSKELPKLFPEANEKMAEQEEKINDLPLKDLEKFF